MNDVAGEAGIRKPSLFHHFPSKEALYLEVIVQIVGELDEIVMDAGRTEGSHLQRLDRLGYLVVEYLGAHPGAARLVLREAIEGETFTGGVGSEMVLAALSQTAAFLKDGMDAGVFAPSEPRHLAVTLVALHFLHFAAAGVTSRFLEEELFTSSALEERRAIVQTQVRRLCGISED